MSIGELTDKIIHEYRQDLDQVINELVTKTLYETKPGRMINVLRERGLNASDLSGLEALHAEGYAWKEINLALRWIEYEDTGRIR